MYELIRPLLFRLDAERAHEIALGVLGLSSRSPGALRLLRAAYEVRDPRLEVRAFGLRFPNPVGLAAGLDKNAVAVPALEALGFGAIEVGSVTAEPQSGNARPRLFRVREDRALINRMGFNNDGADAVAARLARHRAAQAFAVPIGVNVGKSRSAPLAEARGDYERSLRAVWRHADYLVVNVSSPNTPGLRDLQASAALGDLLGTVSALRRELPPRPVLLKIAPDIDESQLDDIIAAAERYELDGLVATNTTTSRTGLTNDPGEAGGLSGQPLAERSLELLRATRVRTALPIVSVGGVGSAADVLLRLRSGATLVQVYTSFVYRGPGSVGAICRELLAACERAGAEDLTELAASASPSAA